MWNSVTSSFVSGANNFQPSSSTCAPVPPRRVSPVRGVGIPPNCSGQTGTITYFSLSLARSSLRHFALRPCQRHGTPKKQRLTKTGSFSACVKVYSRFWSCGCCVDSRECSGKRDFWSGLFIWVSISGIILRNVIVALFMQKSRKGPQKFYIGENYAF